MHFKYVWYVLKNKNVNLLHVYRCQEINIVMKLYRLKILPVIQGVSAETGFFPVRNFNVPL